MKLHFPAAAIAVLLLGCGNSVSSGGTAGSTTTGSTTSTGSGGATTTSSTTGTGGGQACASDADCTANGLSCCGGKCVNERNDLDNCGACGVKCDAKTQYCDGQKCATPTCSVATQCAGLCCFADCCTGGQICCEVQTAGPSQGPKCTDPAPGGSCPIGCPLCK